MEGRLSHRQQQVYELVREGKTQKEIARTLDIRVRTVRHHWYQIKVRTGLLSVQQARLT